MMDSERDKVKSAIKIQAAYRGHKVRVEVKKISKKEKNPKNSSTKEDATKLSS
jgi:hypothetical protein